MAFRDSPPSRSDACRLNPIVTHASPRTYLCSSTIWKQVSDTWILLEKIPACADTNRCTVLTLESVNTETKLHLSNTHKQRENVTRRNMQCRKHASFCGGAQRSFGASVAVKGYVGLKGHVWGIVCFWTAKQAPFPSAAASTILQRPPGASLATNG